jgi:hypothetical protein
MDIEVQDEVTSVLPDIPLDKLAKIYIKIRDARDALTANYKTAYAELEEQLSTLEQQMLDTCKEQGADSIRTPHGTIVRSVKSRYWTNDWDSMYAFIKEVGDFGLLEKRLHQTHMKEFLAENQDVYPQGLNVENSYTVVVRRSKET